MTLASIQEFLPALSNLFVIIGLVISAAIFLFGFKTGQKSSEKTVESERRASEMIAMTAERSAKQEEERWRTQLQVLLKTAEMEHDRQEKGRVLAAEQAHRQMTMVMEQHKQQMEMLRKQHAMEMEHQSRYFEMQLMRAKEAAERDREAKAS